MTALFTARALEESFPDDVSRKRVKFNIIAMRERGHSMVDILWMLQVELGALGVEPQHRTAIAWIVRLIRHEDRYRVRAVP